MCRIYCLLLLTLFTCDYRRVSVACDKEILRVDANAEDAWPRRVHRWSERDEAGVSAEDTEDLTGAGVHQNEESDELVGKWRNNGEALEPKWRDGDTVPLLPFPKFTGYSSDKIDVSEETDDRVRARPKYRQNSEQENSFRSRNNVPPFYEYGDYDPMDNRRRYRERAMEIRKRNKRPWIGQNMANLKETSYRNGEQSVETGENGEIAPARYEEILQVRPNDYEQELNDEEYLKPRPRKRKPPQNYEFALAKNDTLNEEETASSPASGSNANVQKTTSRPAAKNDQFQQNTMELKSLLKMQQQEGLSLSEILQQRNLTLNDLLRGKADVIDALKMRNMDETGDYIEETSRMMSNSFARLPNVAKPHWLIDTEPAKASNSQKDDKLVISIVPTNSTNPSLRKDLMDFEDYSSSNVNRSGMYTEVDETMSRKSTSTVVDVPRGKVASLVSTTITTSIPLPIATNSMDLLRSAVKSRVGDEIKAESPDEDEIMEFSDFTDYKKGRNGVSPVWLMMKNEDSDDPRRSNINHEDGGFTLSIEKILCTTERSELTDNTFSSDRPFLVDSIRVSTGKSVDYGVSSEREYQNDAPSMYHDLEHSTEISIVTNENETSRTITEQIASTPDSTSLGTRQMLSKDSQMVKDINGSPEDHRNANGTEEKNYDDVSEVEPDARAEIFELIASGSAGKRLERLLKSRNMSLEELIALRQRGSSKVHLAEVSRIKVQKSIDEHPSNDNGDHLKTTTLMPSETDRKLTTNRQENYIENINNFVAQSFQNAKICDSLVNTTDSVHSENATMKESRTTLRPDVNNGDSSSNTRSSEHNKKQVITEDQHHTAQIVDLLTTFGSMPFVKDIQRDFANQHDDKDEQDLRTQNNDQTITFVKNNTKMIHVNKTSNVIQSGYVEEVIKQKPDFVDTHTMYDEMNGEDETGNDNRNTLSNVKPSIIASGAILGVTIVVFLAIFIACRIRQRQRYRYRNTFSNTVLQGPVLAARKLSNSSSLSTVMVNVVATSTAKRPEKHETREPIDEIDPNSDIDNDSLDANDSWETIPDYMK